MKIPPYIYINTLEQLEACLDDLAQHPIIGVDLESNSLYVYREFICLIQVSTPDKDYIIDPLPFDPIELAPLGDLLADESIEKIFHASEYDLILMSREFDWHVVNLFDTMWAARILGIHKIGLASLLEQFFEIRLEKRFQTSNWGSRPLSEEMLAYAQRDTHHLFQLRDVLNEKLEAGDHLLESAEIFAKQCDINLPNTDFSPNQFWDLHGVRDLDKEEKKIGFALNLFRDEMAQKYNKPAFKIFDNKALIALSIDQPSGLPQLFDMRGVSNWFIRKEGRKLLRLITSAAERPAPKRPKRPPRPEQELLDRYDHLLNWRKLRGRARGVESDVIMNREAVWEIAKLNPKSIEELTTLVETIGPWRLETYGSDILEQLSNVPVNQRRR